MKLHLTSASGITWPRPPRELIFKPEIYVYIKDFGVESDCGVVAEQDGVIIGAAWTRIIKEPDEQGRRVYKFAHVSSANFCVGFAKRNFRSAYGHIDDGTSELAISVLYDYRGKSIGTMMMEKLFALLYEHGYKCMSLFVQQNNLAVNFYKRLGYEITDEKLDHTGQEDYIMIKEL